MDRDKAVSSVRAVRTNTDNTARALNCKQQITAAQHDKSLPAWLKPLLARPRVEAGVSLLGVSGHVILPAEPLCAVRTAELPVASVDHTKHHTG